MRFPRFLTVMIAAAMLVGSAMVGFSTAEEPDEPKAFPAITEPEPSSR